MRESAGRKPFCGRLSKFADISSVNQATFSLTLAGDDTQLATALASEGLAGSTLASWKVLLPWKPVWGGGLAETVRLDIRFLVSSVCVPPPFKALSRISTSWRSKAKIDTQGCCGWELAAWPWNPAVLMQQLAPM